MGPTGPAGSPAAAVVTGFASLPLFNRTTSLDGRLVSTSSVSPHPADSLAPGSATSVRDFQVRMDPPPPAGEGRSFRLDVDGVAMAR